MYHEKILIIAVRDRNIVSEVILQTKSSALIKAHNSPYFRSELNPYILVVTRCVLETNGVEERPGKGNVGNEYPVCTTTVDHKLKCV